MRKSTLVAILTLFLLVVAVVIVQAQSEPSTCATVVEEALTSVDTICDALNRNAACYGANAVDSTTVVQPRPEAFFMAPGDVAQLADLSEIHPQPLDTTTGTFGVGLLNVQANLPGTLPGQGVLFMLVGGARMTNEVGPQDTAMSPFQAFYFFPGLARSIATRPSR